MIRSPCRHNALIEKIKKAVPSANELGNIPIKTIKLTSVEEQLNKIMENATTTNKIFMNIVEKLIKTKKFIEQTINELKKS